MQFAPNAPDEALHYFGRVARHLDLDPWLGHLVLIEYRGVYRPQITVAGRRVIAFRTGRLRGVVGPEWCGPRRYAPDGTKLPLEWVEVWDDDDTYPYAARCLVYAASYDHPANGTVKWSEFAQHKKDDDLMPTWASMPSHMLGKVAESLALRRGFPEVAAALAYVGDDDTDLAGEAEQPDSPTAAVPPPRAPGSAVPAGASPSSPAGRRDQPPQDLYDNLPEARGWR
ncbi:MAG TPA: recombinase RecT [Acidimicrobiales bacterium]|jgi:hypothetical protein